MPRRTLQQSSNKLAEEFTFHEKLARLNCDAVDVCLSLDQSDPEQRELAPQAVAMAIYSMRGLLLPLIIHAGDLEDISAQQLASAE